MNAIHAEVVDVKPMKTSQTTKIILEIPVEHFKAAALWFGNRVLVTPAPDNMKDTPYGVLSVD